MLGYCRLTSLTRRKEPDNDSQADYLRFYSIHGAGADARRNQEARHSDNESPGCDANADPAGNASLIIKAR
jgi:hypothetical protein